MPSDAPVGDNDPLVGRLIDERYHVVRLLGKGGMGRVYEAVHVGIGKSVAIKVLAPGGAPVIGDRKRFEREAFATGRLEHPNCVIVSDFGALEDGTLFLAMELLRGEPLDKLLEREGRLPAPRALHILRHVLRGLDHAHARGVVHRDLTCRNVYLIDHLGDRDFAKVLDFGLAKLIGSAADSGGGKLTAAGVTFGTPRYMSPEQILGKPVDHRTDIYAASVILFELVSGRTPFVADDMQQVLMKHVTNPPPRIHEVAPDAGVPVEVEMLIRRGLAKEPGERPRSAAAYLQEVEALLAGRPLPADIGVSATVPLTPPRPAPVAMTPPPPPPGRALTPEPRALTPEPRALTREPRALPPEPPAPTPEPRALTPPPQAHARPRRLWPWLVAALFVAGIAAIAIIAASSGGGSPAAPGSAMASSLNRDAGALPVPVAAGDADAGELPAIPAGDDTADAGVPAVLPAEDIPELAEVDALLRAHNRSGAERVLKKLLKKNPRSAGIQYRLGMIYHLRPWPEQAMRYYSAAVRFDPAYAHNETLIGHAIETLTSSSAGWEARQLLLQIGDPAIPHLQKASTSNRSSVIRKLARQMLGQLQAPR